MAQAQTINPGHEGYPEKALKAPTSTESLGDFPSMCAKDILGCDGKVSPGSPPCITDPAQVCRDA